MPSHAMFARIATLAGDPARAAMLHAMMDGRALTASELARAARVTPQTASSHLAQLKDSGLIGVERQGRHRYHRLASAAVAQMIETIMQVASDMEPDRPKLSVGPPDAALRKARTCYDHLAGRLGVALADAMVASGHMELMADAGALTDAGITFLSDIGIDIEAIASQRPRRSSRLLCRPCLDWSERRPHIAGVVGAAICAHSMAKGWTLRQPDTRAVLLTPKGEQIFREKFGVRVG